jgi:hypothetical protein
MVTESLNEAEKWLQKAIDEVPPREEGHIVVGIVHDRLKACSAEFRRTVMKVLERWLLSYNQDHVVWALMLVELLKATEFIPILKKLRWRVLFKLSPLPWNELSYVGGVLKSLQQKERGNN